MCCEQVISITRMKPYDIAIGGCGVAGIAAAALLRQRGARVVVFDQWEAPKPIGSGIIVQPVGLHVLDAIGAGDAMRALGAPITRLFGKSGRHVVLDVRYDALGESAPCGLGVHRGALFQVLYDAACAAGVEIESGRVVSGAGEGRFRFADGSQSAKFDLLIDAAGAWSPLAGAPPNLLSYGALWASLDWVEGFDPAALEQRYEAARKMVGVMPIGRLSGETRTQAAFFWSLKHMDRTAWAVRDLDAWKQEVLALWPDVAPLLAQIRSHEDMVFAAYAHRTRRDPLARGFVHLGDSWHCTSPQLGQGANLALLDAYALAHALARQDDLATALGEYARMRLWHVRLYQLASWAFTPAYQSDSRAFAMVRDWIVSPLARLWPAPQVLAALVAGQVGAPLSAIGHS